MRGLCGMLTTGTARLEAALTLHLGVRVNPLGVWLQTSANFKARLQKAETELEVALSRQHHMQLHLDSAAAQVSSLSHDIESEMLSNAELASECKEQQARCLQVGEASMRSLQVLTDCTNLSTSALSVPHVPGTWTAAFRVIEFDIEFE